MPTSLCDRDRVSLAGLDPVQTVPLGIEGDGVLSQKSEVLYPEEWGGEIARQAELLTITQETPLSPILVLL